MEQPNLWEKSNRKPYWFKPLFRFFWLQEYVDDFLKGRILISTFEGFRNAETQERRDEGEGTIIYEIPHITGSIINGEYIVEGTSNSKEEFKEALSRMGVEVESGARVTNLTFTSASSVTIFPDVYALSFTESLDRKGMKGIGDFAVSISEPQLFMYYVSRKLYDMGLSSGRTAMGQIRYTGRTYGYGEEAPKDPYFLKPADIYAKQQEIRMLWEPYMIGQRIERTFIECPEIIPLVRQVEPIG